MPFDEETNQEEPTIQSQKVGLKKVSSQKSIFDKMPKKPSTEEFEKQVKKAVENNSTYKSKASELAFAFNKAMNDKTLRQNKNIFSNDMEKELLTKMVQLAIDINNDEVEGMDMGSMSWITLLLKTCFSQRDRINTLEYSILQLEKKITSENLLKIISPIDKTKKDG
jgi:hypothetical protein